MNHVDLEYARIIEACLGGYKLTTRNAECYRTRIPSDRTVVFDSTPLVSARKTAWKNCLREMEWFLSGSCDVSDLHESVRPWWQPWANDVGWVFGNYSQQLRRFVGYDFANQYEEGNREVDQVQYLIESIRDHPNSRRAVITTWNTTEMTDPLIPITNCWGTLIQAYVEDGVLHLETHQRSCDVVCGLPHNWLQMWGLFVWLAHQGGRKVGTLTWHGGDVHVYAEHRELAEKIVEAVDHDRMRETPRLVYEPTSKEFSAEDFRLDRPYAPVIEDKARMVV